MQKMKSISDVHVFAQTKIDRGRLILSEEDHLLRRFGKLEIVDISPTAAPLFHLKKSTDQIIAIIDGMIQVQLIDLRKLSPTFGLEMSIEINEIKPQAILIPFGVASSIGSNKKGKVLWLSTHSGGESSQELILERSDIEEMKKTYEG